MIPNIAKSLVGKKIVGVVVKGDLMDYGGHGTNTGDGNTTRDAYVPAGDVYLKLKNGQILCCWNSEWGGVRLLKPSRDARAIELVEKELEHGNGR